MTKCGQYLIWLLTHRLGCPHPITEYLGLCPSSTPDHHFPLMHTLEGSRLGLRKLVPFTRMEDQGCVPGSSLQPSHGHCRYLGSELAGGNSLLLKKIKNK